jgi:FixJ family two-component response regulator
MPSTRRTIFIIDDDPSVRKALSRLLRAAGHHAATFATAEEFLQSPAQPGHDCLVLDVHLPGLCGLGLQQRLKAEGRAVPLVFITAYEEEPARAQALAEGAVAFLHKPFDERALLEAVDRALNQSCEGG